MRLTEIHLDRLPGIREPFALRPAPGINLVVGPNGAGKSSLCRAIGHLLWRERPGERPFSASAVLTADDGSWTVSREDHDPPVWSRDGHAVSPPNLPGAHLAHCYLLDLPDLLENEADDDDRRLATAIAEQLAGGYNLPRVAKDLLAAGSRAGADQQKKWRQAGDRVRELQRALADLARRRDDLPSLQIELEDARQAKELAGALTAYREREIRRTKKNQSELTLADFPPGIARVRDDDLDRISGLQKEIDRLERQGLDLHAEREALLREIDALDLPATARTSADHAGLTDRVQELKQRQGEKEQAERTLAGRLARQEALSAGSAASAPQASTLDARALTTLIGLQQRFLDHRNLADELEKLAREEDAERHEIPWPIIAIPGAVLVLGAAGLLLAGREAMSGIVVAVAGLAGAMLLAWGFHRRGRSRGSATEHSLAAKLEIARRARDTARSDLEARQRELGLDGDAADPRLVDLLRAADQRRRAAADHEGAEAELARWQQQFDAALAELNRELAALDLPPAYDVPEAAAICDSFLGRLERRDQLLKDDDRARRSEKEAAGHLTDRRRELAAITERLQAEPEADPAVHAAALLEDREEWRRVTSDRDEAGRDVQRLDREIEDAADLLRDLDPQNLSPAELTRRIQEKKSAAAAVEDLAGRKRSLEDEIRRTESSGELAAALAEEDECRRKLTDVRRAVYEDALVEMLRDDVLKERDIDADSPLLRKARALFTDFTAGRYHLLVDGDSAEEPFRAEDRDRRHTLRLSELSDGARTQLMLAVRLAFLAGSENAMRPPLFLDQALAASDPIRFHAAARSLGRTAKRQERQVFYLSCDPADEEAWNRSLREEGLDPVHVIDLQAERRLAAASPLPALRTPRVDPVPSPGDLDAADYGRLLLVPGLDPWAPETDIHLFHLMREDLPQLHSLLTAGAARLGDWRARREQLVAGGAQSEDRKKRLAHLGRAAGAFLAAWRRGRGRPVTDEWIREQEIFTDQKSPEVLALNQKVRGDAKRLLDGLREKKVKNLKTAFKDRLAEALDAAGCLPHGEPLTEEELLWEVRRVLAAPLHDGEITAEEARRLVGVLRHAVESFTAEGSVGE